MKMKKLTRGGMVAACVFASVALTACSDDDAAQTPAPAPATGRLFVVCEGQYGLDNASLCVYNPADKSVSADAFARANGYAPGALAQSMTIHRGTGWLVMNGSHCVYAVDPATMKVHGCVDSGISDPRHMLFVSDGKAYVSQLYKAEIAVVDPATYTVTSAIQLPYNAEQMATTGGYVYASCWSYGDKVVRIDPATDRVDLTATVGVQPKELVADAYGRIWVITDGGWQGNPLGYEEPALHCLDGALNELATVALPRADAFSSVGGLCTNASGTALYWYNGRNVYTMTALPQGEPELLVEDAATVVYGLTVNPDNGQIYVADAVDYTHQGTVHRFSADGRVLLDEFKVGICPNAFCWQ